MKLRVLSFNIVYKWTEFKRMFIGLKASLILVGAEFALIFIVEKLA